LKTLRSESYRMGIGLLLSGFVNILTPGLWESKRENPPLGKLLGEQRQVLGGEGPVPVQVGGPAVGGGEAVPLQKQGLGLLQVLAVYGAVAVTVPGHHQEELLPGCA